MSRIIAVIAVALLTVGVLASGGVLAEGEVRNHVPLDAEAATPKDILVGTHVVARVRVPAAGYSVDERADIAVGRILTILSDASLTPDTIAAAVLVRKAGADRAIYVGTNLFFTITGADAKATHATADQLAKMWADNLRAALPKVKPEPGPAPEG